jgi:HEAT repeat protein
MQGMRRRTPLIALILAPFVLWAVVIAWDRVLLPLSAKMWRSAPAVQARLAVGDPEMRARALRDAASAREPEDSTVSMLLASARTERNPMVRATAMRALGAIGERQSLPEDATSLFGELIVNERDEALLSAALEASAKAAANNRVDDTVVRRIGRLLEEKHLPGLFPAAIEALGRIGAAQPLPEDLFTALQTRFAQGKREGEREDLARAFAAIAEGQKLPAPLLDALAAALAGERNYRIRVHAVYALARSIDHYPQARPLLAAANEDPHQNVRSAAAHAERIITAQKLYANRTPMAVALDASLPVEARLQAMGPLKVNQNDAEWREGVLKLARDDEPRVAAAALELFPHISGGADDPFDKRALIPQLIAAMSHPSPQVRRAAYGTLGRQFVTRPGYRDRAQDFSLQLEAGAKDSDPKVRTIVLATMLRAKPGEAEREAIVKRGLEDADPYVRSVAAGWLASPRTGIDDREALLARAQRDSDSNVRRSAEGALKQWQSRERSWPVTLWKLWQEGEHTKAGLMALTAVTIAAPVLVGFVYLIYFMARLLTYLFERRWRALAVLPVMAAWAAASYGMFLLYFMAGHASRLDAWQTFQLAGVLWLAIALYAAAGWGLHYAVRR